MTPADVIRWILQAPVDLLWNGGIGTYVKATARGTPRWAIAPTTRSGSTGTRSGRAWSARQPRLHAAGARGVRPRRRTDQHRLHRQLGRRRHVRPRGEPEGPDGSRDRARDLTFDERNELLESATDDVVRRVLYDNYLQAQILSQEVAVAAERNEACEDLMLQLEAEGELDRAVEFLPRRTRWRNGAVEARAHATGARAAGRLFEAIDQARPARLRPHRRAVPRAGSGRLLPGADRGAVRLLVDGAPAAPRADRHDRGQRRRELAGRDVRLAPRRRDRRHPGRGRARVSDRPRRHRRGGSLGRGRGPRREDRPRGPERADDRGRPAGGGHGALVPRARALPAAERGRRTGAEGLRRAVRGDRPDGTGGLARATRARGRAPGRRRRPGRGRPAARVPGRAGPRTRHHRGRTRDGPNVLEVARGSFLLQARLEVDWLEARLAELAGKTRWRRWAIHSMQDDLASITRQILETVLEERAADRSRRRSTSSCWTGARPARGSDGSCALTMEGVSDLSQFTVALRQLRSLVV